MTREWQGIWRPKPGSILPDGSIVAQHPQAIPGECGGGPLYAFPTGTIWIHHRRQYAAESYGWRATGKTLTTPMGEQLVQVAR